MSLYRLGFTPAYIKAEKKLSVNVAHYNSDFL